MKKTLYIMMTIFVFLAACQKEFSTEPLSQNDGKTPESCSDRASFVTDVTIPTHTSFGPSESFTKTWRIENTGTCIWNDDYSLDFAMNTQMGTPDSVPLKITPPGKRIDISLDLTAPNKNGSYRADFQLFDSNGAAIPIDNGKYMWVISTVETP